MVDLRDFSIKQLADFGQIIVIHSAMNGGKTETLTREMKRSLYFGINSMAYNSHLNVREKNAIVVDGTYHYPALTVSCVNEIKEDFIDRREKLEYFLDKPDTWGEKIDIRGVSHIKGYPLRVLGIDETNLFMLDNQSANEILKLADWCSAELIANYYAGLSHDFRHMEFGLFKKLIDYGDIVGQKKPACMGIPDKRVKCAKPATHTQRLWTREYANSQGLERLFDYNYVDKKHKRIIGKFVPAPFFDLTVASEEAEEVRSSEIIYLPSCRTCVKHPFKDETIRVFDSIRNGNDPYSTIDDVLIANKVLEFLTNPLEGYVKIDSEGKYVALHKHNPFS